MANDPRFNPLQAQPVFLGHPQQQMPQPQLMPVPNLGQPMPQMQPMQAQPVNLGQQGDMTGMHFADAANPTAPVIDAAPQMIASRLQAQRNQR